MYFVFGRVREGPNVWEEDTGFVLFTSVFFLVLEGDLEKEGGVVFGQGEGLPLAFLHPTQYGLGVSDVGFTVGVVCVVGGGVRWED